jgi:hypothetical protein
LGSTRTRFDGIRARDPVLASSSLPRARYRKPCPSDASSATASPAQASSAIAWRVSSASHSRQSRASATCRSGTSAASRRTCHDRRVRLAVLGGQPDQRRAARMAPGPVRADRRHPRALGGVSLRLVTAGRHGMAAGSLPWLARSSARGGPAVERLGRGWERTGPGPPGPGGVSTTAVVFMSKPAPAGPGGPRRPRCRGRSAP